MSLVRLKTNLYKFMNSKKKKEKKNNHKKQV